MGNAAITTKSLCSVVLGDGQHEALVLGDLGNTQGPGVELGLVGQADLGLDEGGLVVAALDQLGGGEERMGDFQLLEGLGVIDGC